MLLREPGLLTTTVARRTKVGWSREVSRLDDGSPWKVYLVRMQPHAIRCGAVCFLLSTSNDLLYFAPSGFTPTFQTEKLSLQPVCLTGKHDPPQGKPLMGSQYSVPNIIPPIRIFTSLKIFLSRFLLSPPTQPITS